MPDDNEDTVIEKYVIDSLMVNKINTHKTSCYFIF